MKKRFRYSLILLAVVLIINMLPVISFADAATVAPNGLVLAATEQESGRASGFLYLDKIIDSSGKAYYGLLMREHVHVWSGKYGSAGSGYSFGLQDDTQDHSPDTASYKTWWRYTSSATVSFDSMQKYISNQVIDLGTRPTYGEHIKVNGKIHLATSQQIIDNMSYLDDFTYGARISRTYTPYQEASGVYFSSVKTDGTVALVKANSGSHVSIYPLVYVTADFFKNEKLDVSQLGDDVKALFVEDFYADELESIYTAEELNTIGFKEEVVESVPGSAITANGNTYFLTNDYKTIGDKKYVGIVSTTPVSVSGGGIKARLMVENLDAEAVNGVKAVNPKLYYEYANWGSTWWIYNAPNDYKETLFPSSVFNGCLATLDWTMGEDVGPESADVVVKDTEVFLPSHKEITDLIAMGNTFTTTQANIMTRSMDYYADAVEPYYFVKRYNIANPLTGGNVSVKYTDHTTQAQGWNTRSGYSTPEGGEYFLMAYVSEDFFKANKLDVATMGDYAKKAMANVVSRYAVTGLYTSKELDAIYGRIALRYNTTISDNSVEAVVSVVNKTNVSIPASAYLIIAVYGEDSFLGAVAEPLGQEIAAGSTLSGIERTVSEISDTTGCTVKAMLWESLDNIVPLCKAK